jgi:hypothetical protein
LGIYRVSTMCSSVGAEHQIGSGKGSRRGILDLEYAQKYKPFIFLLVILRKDTGIPACTREKRETQCYRC